MTALSAHNPGDGWVSAARSRQASVAALVLAVLAFLGVYLYLERNVGLANDEWYFLLYRSTGFQAVVFPYNNGPVVGEILLYRLWAGSVGVAHHWVLNLLFGTLQSVIAGLVYGMARRRVGSWAALGMAILVLFLGRAWETILFGATLTFVAPALAGCAAWAALDRRSRWPMRLVVGVLLAVASVTGGLGTALLVGLVAEIALTRRWQWVWPLAIGVVPLIMWYAYEAGNTGTHLSANLPHLPLWAAKYLVASAGAVFGLPPPGGIGVMVIAAAAIFVWRRHAPARSWWSARAVGLLTTLAVAAVTIGAARAVDTPPSSSRYLYFPAILMLLLACEWTRGLRVSRPRAAAAGAAVVVLAALALGVQQLRHGKVFYLDSADGTAARMGAMKLARGPRLVIEPSRLAYTPAVVGTFIRRYGSAAIDTEARIAEALPQSRAAADQVLAQADIHRPGPLRSCRRWPAGRSIPGGNLTVAISAPGPGSARLVRFAPLGDAVSIAVGPRPTAFALRHDPIVRPWQVFLPAGAILRLCAYPDVAASLPSATTF